MPILLAAFASVAIAWIRGVSPLRLATIPLRGLGLPLLAFLLQILAVAPLETLAGGPTPVLWLQMASRALLLGFIALNVRYRSLLLVGLGTALNLLVMLANDGYMPVRPPDRGAEAGGAVQGSLHKTRLMDASTRLPFLGDWIFIPLPGPDRIISPGDVLIAAGAFLFPQEALMPGQERRTKDSGSESQRAAMARSHRGGRRRTGTARPVWLVPRAAYLHVPFCSTKCLYCDFNTYAGKAHLIDAYVDALAQEVERRTTEAAELPLRTVYFGGGTPSLLPAAAVQRLLDTLRHGYGIQPGAEITLEANPGTFDRAYLDRLAAAGVNRLSIGVQSLDDETLRRLARTHDAAEAIAAVRLARESEIDSVSLDLIYGLPWQTREQWQVDLERALTTEPDHISLYALMVETGTPLANLVASGTWQVPDDDAVADMYEAALPILERAAFVHYEVSNWARAGHASRHNLTYWRNDAYLGFGAGAHSYVQGRRFWNVKPIETYMQRISGGESPIEGDETLAPKAQLGETAALALRLRLEGLEFQRFRSRFGFDPAVRWRAQLDELGRLGLLEVDAERATLTDAGLLVSNEIALRFLDH
ncbi:MAG TPA: radical SAM family heme chaperone HemW [Chloroflexota bacterium]|nr:radical SAM family heme chaperone HemW [Chloroflexota bacterium]